MTTEAFRDKTLELIDATACKIWLTKISGHRLDFLFSAGGAQLDPIKRIARKGEYILMGQHVPESVVSQLELLLRDYALMNPSEL